MATLNPVDTVLSAGQRIGRYFSLVTLIPSLFLVAWIYILISSGALSARPSLKHISSELSSHWSVSAALGLALASLAVAVVLHPLQFATTRLLEGYWGTSPLAIAAMKSRIIHHRKRRRELRRIWRYNGRTLRARLLNEHPELTKVKEKDRADRIGDLLRTEQGDSLLLHLIAEQEALSQEGRYPSDDSRILPTQLGNALRSFEDSAGRRYGLDAITISPLLHLVAPDRHLDYLKDAREDMDSAIQICTVGFIAFALTVAVLLTDGAWLLWSILPYSVSYLAYKGAVSAAENYGVVVNSVIDLDRFLIYDMLGLHLPRDSSEEKESNAKLISFLTGGTATLAYRRKDSASNRPPSSVSRRRTTGTNS